MGPHIRKRLHTVFSAKRLFDNWYHATATANPSSLQREVEVFQTRHLITISIACLLNFESSDYHTISVSFWFWCGIIFNLYMANLDITTSVVFKFKRIASPSDHPQSRAFRPDWICTQWREVKLGLWNLNTPRLYSHLCSALRRQSKIWTDRI